MQLFCTEIFCCCCFVLFSTFFSSHGKWLALCVFYIAANFTICWKMNMDALAHSTHARTRAHALAEVSSVCGYGGKLSTNFTCIEHKWCDKTLTSPNLIYIRFVSVNAGWWYFFFSVVQFIIDIAIFSVSWTFSPLLHWLFAHSHSRMKWLQLFPFIFVALIQISIKLTNYNRTSPFCVVGNEISKKQQAQGRPRKNRRKMQKYT